MSDVVSILVIFFISVVLHEIAHGYAALRFGDNTALRAGRLSLNPLKHIDPSSTIFLPLVLWVLNSPFIIASAKPVPVRFDRLLPRKLGIICVALAGVVVNLLLAFLAFALLFEVAAESWQATFLIKAMFINLMLFSFNLIPIPPLDGSRVLRLFMPGALGRFMDRLEPFGILIVFLALWLYSFLADTSIVSLLFPIVSNILSLFALICQSIPLALQSYHGY